MPSWGSAGLRPYAEIGGGSVEGGGEIGFAEMFEHVGDLGRSDADQGKRRELLFREELSVGSFVTVLGSATGEFGEEKEFVAMEDVRWLAVEVTIEDGGKLCDADFVSRFFASFAGGRDGRRLADVGPTAGESPAAVFEFADEEDLVVAKGGDANIDFGSGVAGL